MYNVCIYCNKNFTNENDVYLVEKRDKRFQGRKRCQIVGYCCTECENNGKLTHLNQEEWENFLKERRTK